MEGLFLAVFITLLALLGKLAASSLAAYSSGISGRDSLAIGTLMNTRGLVELIVLHLGLSLGIIGPVMYGAYLFMTFVCTLLTTPLFRLITRTRPWTNIASHVSPPAKATLR